MNETHPYIQKIIDSSKMSGYLQAKYGIRSNDAELPTLSLPEKKIENDIGTLLQLVDLHMEFWRRTTSKTTLNALIATRATIFSLLNALHQPHNRIERTCAALYGQNVADLCLSFRTPPPRNADAIALSARVRNDRNEFKQLLREIVISLIQASASAESSAQIAALVAAPHETMTGFLEKTVQQLDSVDVDANLPAIESQGVIESSGVDSIYT